MAVVGAKATVIWQDAPTAKLVPQVVLGSVNSPGYVDEATIGDPSPLSATDPVFVSVTVAFPVA